MRRSATPSREPSSLQDITVPVLNAFLRRLLESGRRKPDNNTVMYEYWNARRHYRDGLGPGSLADEQGMRHVDLCGQGGGKPFPPWPRPSRAHSRSRAEVGQERSPSSPPRAQRRRRLAGQLGTPHARRRSEHPHSAESVGERNTQPRGQLVECPWLRPIAGRLAVSRRAACSAGFTLRYCPCDPPRSARSSPGAPG